MRCGLNMKRPKSFAFDNTQVRDAKPLKSSNCRWSGKISNFKEKRSPQMENVGDKRLSTWKECWSWD